MDTLGKLYLIATIPVLVGVVVAFRYLSLCAPRGTLLAVGVVLWLIGVPLSESRVREIAGVGSLCMVFGFIGGIWGLISFFRRKSRPVRPLPASLSDNDENA